MRSRAVLVALATALCVSALPNLHQRDADVCTPNTDGALQITAYCIDPEYAVPIIDIEEDEISPIPHRKVSGHFNDTNVDFNIYLTPRAQWRGRFFQLAYPSQTSIADANAIAFGVESGGYTVQVSGSQGYRADAAAAKLSRAIAEEYYNVSSKDIYGYIYGGSGGSLKAVGAAENTFGVWDGCVALIQAIPMSIPYNWGIRALGGLVLANHTQEMIEMAQPGGSGDPCSVLDEHQCAIFKETKALGVPVRGWEDWASIVGNRTQLWQTMKDIAVPTIQSMDPTYADDFWTKDGYAGSEQSALGDLFRATFVQFDTVIQFAKVGRDGFTSEFVVDYLPAGDVDVVGLGFSVMVNNTRQHFSGMMNPRTRTVYILAGAPTSTLEALVPGAEIQIDNGWYLAAHTLHRHQIGERDFYAHDYLRDGQGEPLYPQRDLLIGPVISSSTSGGAVLTGNITMKVIIMDNLLDFDAFPWHADYYQNKVREAKGDLEDHYRLYYSENANHVMGEIKAPYTSRVVDFTGLYQQHLRDLSAWVEHGVNPPEPTNYTVSKGQVIVPALASERLGIQPVVDLLVGGLKVAHALPGETKKFLVEVHVPLGIGQIVALEWDPLGTGEYAAMNVEVGDSIKLQLSYAYDRPGIYVAGIRAASHRDGNDETEIALAWNLDRVKVIVQ